MVIYVLLLDFLLDQATAALLNLETLVTKEWLAELTRLFEVEWLLTDAVLQMIQINSLASFETEIGGDASLKVLNTADVVNTWLLY